MCMRVCVCYVYVCMHLYICVYKYMYNVDIMLKPAVLDVNDTLNSKYFMKLFF